MAEINLPDVYQELVNELKNLSDLRRVPDEPPENNDQFPFAFPYVWRAEYKTASKGFFTALYDIRIELHLLRGDLPRSYGAALHLIEDIPKQLTSGLINRRFTKDFTWTNIDFIYSNFEFGGVPTIGGIFTIYKAKIQATVS